MRFPHIFPLLDLDSETRILLFVAYFEHAHGILRKWALTGQATSLSEKLIDDLQATRDRDRLVLTLVALVVLKRLRHNRNDGWTISAILEAESSLMKDNLTRFEDIVMSKLTKSKVNVLKEMMAACLKAVHWTNSIKNSNRDENYSTQLCSFHAAQLVEAARLPADLPEESDSQFESLEFAMESLEFAAPVNAPDSSEHTSEYEYFWHRLRDGLTHDEGMARVLEAKLRANTSRGGRKDEAD